MRHLWKDRRRAQSGATLIELLVSLVIMGLALVLIIGTVSTGLLDASLAKRNTAAQAVTQYELEQISGGPFVSPPQAYAECFATENAAPPSPAPPSPGNCSAGYPLRAEVSGSPGPPGTQTQVWTVSVFANGVRIGNSVSVVKARR